MSFAAAFEGLFLRFTNGMWIGFCVPQLSHYYYSTVSHTRVAKGFYAKNKPIKMIELSMYPKSQVQVNPIDRYDVEFLIEYWFAMMGIWVP